MFHAAYDRFDLRPSLRQSLCRTEPRRWAMRCVMLITGAMVLVAAVGQSARGADDSDETKIRGTWQLVSKTHKGVETKIDAKGDAPPDDQQMVLTFEEQSLKVNFGPKRGAGRKDGHLFSRSQANAQAVRLHDSRRQRLHRCSRNLQDRAGSAVHSSPRGLRPASARL